MAKELGADFQLPVERGDEPQRLARSVAELLGAPPHVTIECTGAESSIQTAIFVRTVPPSAKHKQQQADTVVLVYYGNCILLYCSL